MKSRIKNWNLDKKILIVTAALIYIITAVTVVIFSVFYLTSFIRQATNISSEQLNSLAVNYESSLNGYKELVEALIIDESIQAYVKSDGKKDENYFSLVNNVNGTMQYTLNMRSDLKFFSIVSYQFDGFLYKGTLTRISNSFENVYWQDYMHCDESRDPGTIRMSYNDVYLPGENLLNVYLPIYSITNMINEMGLMVMVFEDSLFESPDMGKSPLRYDGETMLVDGAGNVVSSKDETRIGMPFEHADRLTGDGGSFVVQSSLYNFRKIGKWNYMLISRIPLIDVYRDNIVVILIMFIVSVTMSYFGMLISKSIIRKTYRPIDVVIRGMGAAGEGNLGVRINMENVGVDFVKLANGFNYMMEEINGLVSQVKREQQQMEQLRLNALQSQIQPHFLYNALDCIRWQASADGQGELAVFVKSLAQYYRLCLSKGKDIIPLAQEIEHVRNYLVIQNLRYDNIIQGIIEVDENCMNVPIPKITLQPLVENAIYHGIKGKGAGKGVVRISARWVQGEVEILVSDNGPVLSEKEIRTMNHSLSEEKPAFGYGVRNVNKRIELLFGREYGLTFDGNPSGGLTVHIRLPGREPVSVVEVM